MIVGLVLLPVLFMITIAAATGQPGKATLGGIPLHHVSDWIVPLFGGYVVWFAAAHILRGAAWFDRRKLAAVVLAVAPLALQAGVTPGFPVTASSFGLVLVAIAASWRFREMPWQGQVVAGLGFLVLRSLLYDITGASAGAAPGSWFEASFRCWGSAVGNHAFVDILQFAAFGILGLLLGRIALSRRPAGEQVILVGLGLGCGIACELATNPSFDPSVRVWSVLAASFCAAALHVVTSRAAESEGYSY